jgi:3-hydroxy-9,10-secoandrosta-1,3,5(10)-triene-9,17-dione monooxygenase
MAVPPVNVKSAQAPSSLTPAEALASAVALGAKVRAEAAETEARTFHSEELHLDFVEAGFYHLLRPRMFGGYEFEVLDFMRVIRELARADTSTAWCLCLASGHNLQMASWWPEEAQREVFGSGHFAASMTSAPGGMMRRTASGWTVSAVLPYSSGIPYSTHVMGHAFIDDGTGGAPGPLTAFVVERSAVTIRDDWGHTLGLRGSGSHTVEVPAVTVPDHWVLEGVAQTDVDVSDGTPGLRLHGNPLYGGRGLGFFGMELANLAVGAVAGALDEYEALLHTKRTVLPPITSRAENPHYQLWYADARTALTNAEAGLDRAAELFHEYTHRAADGSAPFSITDDMHINRVAVHAQMIAWRALEGIIMRTAGSSAAAQGQRLERIWRDSTMALSHQNTVLQDFVGEAYGAASLAQSATR